MAQLIKPFSNHYILFGLPCSGKGVHANIIKSFADKDLQVIEMGSLFRQEVKNNTPMGKIVKATADRGDLLPDKYALEIVERYDLKRNTLFDGFPRTKGQAEEYVRRINILKQEHNHYINPMIINITASNPNNMDNFTKVLLLRMLSRISDAAISGQEIRQDDQLDILRHRIEIAKSETFPALYDMESAGIPVLNVNGELDIFDSKDIRNYTDRLFEVHDFLSHNHNMFLEKNKIYQKSTR